MEVCGGLSWVLTIAMGLWRHEDPFVAVEGDGGKWRQNEVFIHTRSSVKNEETFNIFLILSKIPQCETQIPLNLQKTFQFSQDLDLLQWHKIPFMKLKNLGSSSKKESRHYKKCFLLFFQD